MSGFATDLRIGDPDEFYARLVALHEGLTQSESNRLNARLILLLANQVGDDAVLAEILEAARAEAGGARGQD